jgi:hypothetical protein
MQCRKCHFENPEGSVECRKCGIVFAKYHPPQEPAKPVEPQAEDLELQKKRQDELRTEFRCRLLGIPVALIVMRLGVATIPFGVRLLTMLVHETGHAVAAWICGYLAVPLLWFTAHTETQESVVPLMIILGLGILCFWAWKTNRWHVIAISVAVLFLHWICWHARYDRAQEIIVFFGDGGALVLGTFLMLTLYVPRESPIYREELRWGFLAIGAAAFVDTFHSWSGSESDIPFGVQEGTQTDPSKLVEFYGWTIPDMVHRYLLLAELCFIALAIVYVIGLIQARRKMV